MRNWSRRFVQAAFLSLIVALAAPSGAATIFIDALGDVPLMPGLALAPDETVSFDAPQGRIVRVTTVAQRPRLTRQAVLDFYRHTMPNLGWSGGPMRYRRDNEALEIGFGRLDGRLSVTFSLQPAKRRK